jgi:predicted aminopeptidase
MNIIPKLAAQFRPAALLFIFPFLVSCAHLAGPDYYAQLITGETHVLLNRVPIRTMLDDKRTPEKLKKNLRSVLEMREFAIQTLGLPQTDSYTAYMNTGREFSNWSLTAAPEFSIHPKMWCFPLAGCASHLTFFNESMAKRYEQKLLRQGYDVYVRGVTSYSTGGYFSDPAMSPLFDMPDYAYASIIFHEMAHEKLIIKNEPTFNESFAMFVGLTGRYLWTKKHYGMNAAERFLEQERRSVEFSALIGATGRELDALYLQNLAPEETRILKHGLFMKMRREYAALKIQWGGYAGFDGWFAKPINNARIAGENEYGNFVPVFRKLFEFSGRDFQYFYQKTERLSKLSPSARAAEIQNILKDEPTR